ncbi:MAG: CBS domain-containing protein [Promethearchaeota archaeon]
MKMFPNLKEIKYLRKKLDISQQKLAKKLNINQSTISRIENEEIDPPYSKVKIIFEFLEKERMKRKKLKKNAEDLMTKKIISITSKSTIKEAVELMNKYNISQLPIIENGQNLGSITSKKIQKTITDNPNLINGDINLIKELPFPEIEKDWDIQEISNLLSNYPAILVKELGNYIGIITDADFLKFA